MLLVSYILNTGPNWARDTKLYGASKMIVRLLFIVALCLTIYNFRQTRHKKWLIAGNIVANYMTCVELVWKSNQELDLRTGLEIFEVEAISLVGFILNAVGTYYLDSPLRIAAPA